MQSQFTFSVNQIASNINPDFGLEQKLFSIEYPDNLQTFDEASNEIERMLREVHMVFTSTMQNRDKIRAVFFHKDFRSCIDLPFLKKTQFTVDLLIESFENVIQSYKDIIINDNNTFSANVQIQRMPVGTGRRCVAIKKTRKPYKPKIKVNNNIFTSNNLNSLQEICNNKYSVINLINTDNMCCLRAILIAIRYCDNYEDKLNYSKQNNSKLNADVIYFQKNLNLPDDGCGIEELKQIEIFIEEYCITVIDGSAIKSNSFLYRGPKNKKFIYLLYLNGHYSVITSMKAFLDRSYYCNYCNIGYNNAHKHSCIELCNSCKSFECNKLSVKPLKCINCKISAFSERCLQRHCDIICKKRIICEKCGFYKSRLHVCLDEKYCTKCKLVVDLSHMCYINTDVTVDKPFEGYIFFDYEAFQENGIHIPNLIIANKVCKKCLEIGGMCKELCQKICVDNNDSFCSWLFQQKDCIAIAHNSKSYDSIFINNWINDNLHFLDKIPSFIRVGSKILSLEFRSVKVICSLSFLPMPLANFAKTFDLKEAKKGFFPHLFNTRGNQAYIGDYPDQDYYQPKFMSESKKMEFDEWYSHIIFNRDGSKAVFNFQKEIISYCESDVDILMKGCLTFRKIIMDITDGIDPFQKSITIASLAHYIYRTSLMEPNTIAILPDNGYHGNERTSRKAMLWLKYISEQKGVFLQHAKNLGEYKVGKYRVDGYDSITNTAYEFNGDLFHGNLMCYKPDTFIPFLQTTIAGLNQRHIIRENELKKSVNLISIYECEWDNLCKTDQSVIDFIKKNDYQLPLNPRDGFYGGRTEAFVLYKKNIVAKYIDYTSLYPDRQKYCRYPKGHPLIITENFKDVSEYFGVIKCKILPPNSLYFPVLPTRINGKLLFCLCSLCGDKKFSKCTHNDEERCLDGTWITLEIQQALKQGYKILKIYEIWHYEESSIYDKDSKTGGLFSSYINMFLKVKQESSGYPKNVVSDKEKDKYIQDYYDNEGILLEKSKIKLNEGMRAISKLLLNSHWGRFGMNTNKSQYKLIRDPIEWYNLISDDQIIVQSADFTHKKYLQVYFIHANNMHESSSNVNVVLAAFVTTHARLKLLKEITLLGERVLYVDTDSIIYESIPNKYEPILGIYVGQFTNELKETIYIIEFVSAGPKNYCYMKSDGTSMALVKGFALNHTASKKINFESIRDVVTHDQKKNITTEQIRFSRDKVDWTNSTSIIQKNYRLVFDKRILFPDHSTLPFGWKG